MTSTAEQPLIDELASASGFRRVGIAAELGDASGPAGPSVLRELIATTGPRTRDLRCAALLALVKRVGEQARPDLITSLGSSDAEVRNYARMCIEHLDAPEPDPDNQRAALFMPL